jgi:hypothetical protein
LILGSAVSATTAGIYAIGTGNANVDTIATKAEPVVANTTHATDTAAAFAASAVTSVVTPLIESALTASATDDKNAIRKAVAAFSYIRRATAAVTAASTEASGAARCATVKSAMPAETSPTDENGQRLMRAYGNVRTNTPTVRNGGARSIAAMGNNSNPPHMGWHRKKLLSAGVLERLMMSENIAANVRSG